MAPLLLLCRARLLGEGLRLARVVSACDRFRRELVREGEAEAAMAAPDSGDGWLGWFAEPVLPAPTVAAKEPGGGGFGFDFVPAGVATSALGRREREDGVGPCCGGGCFGAGAFEDGGGLVGRWGLTSTCRVRVWDVRAADRCVREERPPSERAGELVVDAAKAAAAAALARVQGGDSTMFIVAARRAAEEECE